MTEANKHNQAQESAMPKSSSTGKPEKKGPVEAASVEQKQTPTSTEGADATALAKEFVSRLSKEERMLILLQSELYENSWLAMLNDLRNRLDGKPFIFKLASRIQDDMARIEKLQSFEQKHNVKLSEFVNPP